MSTRIGRALLVVDDNPATRYATSRVLRNAGFEVSEAATGTAGIDAANATPVDLVVLDIDLPDIDGYEVCRRIREMPATRRVRVVYLSASFFDDKHKVRGFEAGADGFLNHPVEAAVLIATVGALLRTRAIERELEELLTRERIAREEAESANRAKDDFLATLSHELRSPLTAIVGWAEVARMQSENYPDILNSVQVIARNAKLQSQLISDLLDVSRITTGNMRLEFEAVSVVEVVRTSVDALIGTAAAREIGLDVQLDESVGKMYGDPGRLYQIVSNLLSNALKFSDAGGCVQVRLRQVRDDLAELVIADNGRGISAAVLPRIFDRFWQEDTSSRRSHGGLGLGLSIVKHFTEMHGGTVTGLSDGEGKGARFTITLPLLPSDVILAETSVLPEERETTGQIDLTGVRVLIVDDEADGREWVRHVIALAGADTMDVDNVNDALAAVEAFSPHIIVSDLAMPVRNGYDLVAELRRTGHPATVLPVIALSAFASAEDKRRALDAGFQHFLSKPPDSRELLRTVRRLSRKTERS
ncbi:MAG: response regulator [Gemmatimonadaceae bacterium]